MKLGQVCGIDSSMFVRGEKILELYYPTHYNTKENGTEENKMKNLLKSLKNKKYKKNGVETNFINIVKITQVGECDYILQLFNTYSDEAWVFKIYKQLFDKGMEIRNIIDLKIITSEDEADKKVKGAELYA